jgi:DnaK suppressor protein
MNFKSIKETLLAQRSELSGGVSREDIVIERLSDSLDDVQHSAERDLAITSLNRHWRTVKQINAALERIEEGTYGHCLNCEEPIGEKRLRALPWAELCIRCQEANDEAAAEYVAEAA